jgi:hypothetical protein
MDDRRFASISLQPFRLSSTQPTTNINQRPGSLVWLVSSNPSKQKTGRGNSTSIYTKQALVH